MRRPPAPRPTFGVGALTRTERSVVNLVGDGLTNTEIAHRMGISRRTVETHVSSIYRKLEVSTRVAIARVALRATDGVRLTA
jgi:DNA-binding NarL/FixJ family response regulator